MKDINKYYFEFSRLYIRLMRLETNIKQGLINSLLPVYKEEILSVFSAFFQNKNRLARYQSKYTNKLNSIIKNPQIESNSKKFISIVNNVLFLSDLIFIFLHCEQFRKKEIIENFYFKVPQKYSELLNSKENILNLRNAVAHFNFKDYQSNKKSYLEALKIFETYIGHNIPGIQSLPILPYKPTLKEILNSIYSLNPSLINKETKDRSYLNCEQDRLLLELCDEIALYNGYEVDELYSPWSILREKYRIKSKNI